MLNVGALWAAILLSIFLEGIWSFRNGDHQQFLGSILNAGVTLPTLLFSYYFFQRKHGFEMLVGITKSFGENDFRLRQRLQEKFDRTSVAHLLLLLGAVIAFTALKIVQLDEWQMAAYSYTAAVHRLLVAAAVVRELFHWTFLMFFSLVCAAQRLVIDGVVAEIDNIGLKDPGWVIKRHRDLHRSISDVSESFQLILSMHIVFSSVRVCAHYAAESGAFSVLHAFSLLEHSAELAMLVVPPAMTTHACGRVAMVVAAMRAGVAPSSHTGAPPVAQELDSILQYLTTTRHAFAFTVFGMTVAPAHAAAVLFALSTLLLLDLRRSVV